MARPLILLFLGTLLLVTGCDTGPKSAQGFRLPDGDPGKGEQSFLALGCHSCHSIANLELPNAIVEGPVQVELGGHLLQRAPQLLQL